MRNYIAIAMSVLALDITPVLAACQVRARAVAVVQKQVVAQAVVVPSLIAVTAYGAGYQPHSADAADQRIDDILRELRALRQDVNALKAAGTAPQQPGAALNAVQAIFANKCAACHDQADNAKDGGGLVLTVGKVLKTDLDAKVVSKVLSKSYTGRMPPPNNGKNVPALTDDEVSKLVDHYDGQK